MYPIHYSMATYRNRRGEICNAYFIFRMKRSRRNSFSFYNYGASWGEEPKCRFKTSRVSRFENLVRHIAITLLWRLADIMLSILMNFPYSSVFQDISISVVCQEKHINSMYLHMDIQRPTGSSSLKTASCLCFPAALFIWWSVLQGKQWFFPYVTRVIKVWIPELVILILRFALMTKAIKLCLLQTITILIFFCMRTMMFRTNY
jgi:hypothetical protein